MSRHEKWFLAAFSFFLILYTTGPYLFGYFMRPAGFMFTWISPLHKNDTHVYYSYIRQAMAGAWSFRDLYTTEVQRVGVLNVFWLLVGWLAHAFGASPAIISQMVRIALIPIAVWCIYLFACALFASPRVRMTATVWAVFAGGFGAYVASTIVRTHFDQAITSAEFPLDLVAGEFSPYLAFIHSPHFVASLIALLGTLWLIFRGVSSNRLRYSCAAGVLGLFFFNFHPYYAIPVAFITIVFVLCQIVCHELTTRRGLLHVIAVGVLSAPSIFYHAWLMLTDPITMARNLQNVTPTPSFSMVIISYGGLLLGLGVAIALVARLRRHTPILRFMAIWAIVSFAALFLPISFSHRFVEGLVIPFVFLIVHAITTRGRIQASHFWKKYPLIIAFIFSFIFLATPASRTVTMYRFFTKPDHADFEYPDAYPLIYIDPDRARVFSAMAKEPVGSMRVLSGILNNQLIPGETGQISYAGHWAETLDPTIKGDAARAFFKTNDHDGEKQAWLKRTGLTHLLYSPLEKVYGEYDPDAKPYLAPVFRSGKVALYAIK